MATFDELRAEVLALASDVWSRTRGRDVAEAADRLGRAIDRLRDGKLTVVVCGEHNQGKSRLLNAFLDEPGLFPVDSFFATRLVTRVTYGETETVTVELDDGTGGTRQRTIRREDIAGYATQLDDGGPPDAASAVIVEITLPHPKLTGGLTFVDTPGVGGVYHAHSEVTKKYLPRADAVLFVTSFGQSLMRSELDFLTQAADAVQAAEHPDSVLFVLTKSDQKADPIERRALLDSARERLAQATRRDPADIVVCPVSSKTKERAARTGSEDLLARSGFRELETALHAQLARYRAALLLGGALEKTQATIDVLLAPLQLAEKAHRASSAAEIAELTAQLEADQRRLDVLDGSKAQWRDDLQTRLRELAETFQRRAADGVDRVWARAESEYLSQEYYLAKPRRLGDELASQVGMAISAVNEWAAQQAAAVQRTIVAASGLAMGSAAFAHLPPPRVLDLSSYGNLRSRTRKEWVDTSGMRKTGTKRYTGVRGAAVKVAGWFGYEKEATAFMNRNFYNESKLVDEERWVESGYWIERDDGIAPEALTARRAELRVVLAEDRERVRHAVADATAQLVREYTAGTIAEMESLITQDRQRIADSLPRLQKALESTAEQAAAELAELIDEQQPLDEAAEQVARLVRTVDRLRQPGNPEGTS